MHADSSVLRQVLEESNMISSNLNEPRYHNASMPPLSLLLFQLGHTRRTYRIRAPCAPTQCHFPAINTPGNAT